MVGMLLTSHTKQVQLRSPCTSQMLFHYTAEPILLFHPIVIADYFLLSSCGTLPSLKRSLARPGWHCQADDQFDFIPSFVICAAGGSCHLCMHKSRAQGLFASDLLPAENLNVSMWLWQPSSLPAELPLWVALFVTCIFSGTSSCTVHYNSYFYMMPQVS